MSPLNKHLCKTGNIISDCVCSCNKYKINKIFTFYQTVVVLIELHLHISLISESRHVLFQVSSLLMSHYFLHHVGNFFATDNILDVVDNVVLNWVLEHHLARTALNHKLVCVRNIQQFYLFVVDPKKDKFNFYKLEKMS